MVSRGNGIDGKNGASPIEVAPEVISLDEKRQALGRILMSHTLGRSDQLRSFLRYICEAEFEGRTEEINEYALGVSVLGRRPDYNPAEDSCVRSRAYELRNKLKSYYQLESPDDPIQIDIHKGGYVPRFERRTQIGQGKNVAALEPAVPAPPDIPAKPPGPERKPYPFRLGIVLFFIAALIAAATLYGTRLVQKTEAPKTMEPPALSPELAALWKPFLDSGSPLLISFQIRLFFYSPSSNLVVRDFEVNQPADVPKSKSLSAFQTRMDSHDLRETSDYTDFGSVHAVFLLGRLLDPFNKEVLLKHSTSLGWEDIWNNNVIFLGKPHLNPSIHYALQGADFVDDEFGVIHNLHPIAGESAEYRCAPTHGSGEKYGLITLLQGPQPGHRILILDGSGSELMWALAESVTNPTYVKAILSHVQQPTGDMPEAFQVVIQATFESNVPVKIRYVTHRVSKIS